MKEIIAYLGIFFFLGTIVGWSYSEYKILRLESLKNKIDQYQSEQESHKQQVEKIKSEIEETMTKKFQDLKMNKFFTVCQRISSSSPEVKFGMEFVSVPKVFVSVNKFIITYGSEGSLEK